MLTLTCDELLVLRALHHAIVYECMNSFDDTAVVAAAKSEDTH